MHIVDMPLPRLGMLATIRNRRGIITSVEPYGSPTEAQLHLVAIEYTDTDGPLEDRVIWEREVGARVWGPSLQTIQPSQTLPMQGDQFDALVRTTCWLAMSPFLDPDDGGPLERNPISAPLYGVIQVEDYQAVPLAKALAMPRISLPLVADVGLGKTIEAGLIVSELVLRRRARQSQPVAGCLDERFLPWQLALQPNPPDLASTPRQSTLREHLP